MKEISKILVYFVAVLLLGAALAPPLFWAGQYAIEAGWLPELRPFGFPKYFNRAVLVVALVTLWPFLRWVGLRHWSELYLRPNPRRFKDLSSGAALGFFGLWVVACAAFFIGQAEWRESIRPINIGAALLTAIVVSIIEECFFRGALLGVLRQRLTAMQALWFLSVFFAILHFLKPDPQLGAIEHVDWLSGFRLIPHAFWQFAEWRLVLGGFITLALVGFTLGYSVIKTESLYFALGLHGGWVFAMRSFFYSTQRIGDPSIWLGRDLTVGILPVVLLICTLGIVYKMLRARALPSS